MSEMIEAATEAIAELIEDPYPPKPGGLVDKHRKRVAAEQAEVEGETQELERIEQPSYRAVKVAPESPEVFAAITYTISAGATAPILPLNKYRYRATVMVITASGSVVLAKDNGNAISGVGFVLPVNVPVVLFSRAQVYAFNNTQSSVQVSVMMESYAPEKS